MSYGIVYFYSIITLIAYANSANASYISIAEAMGFTAHLDNSWKKNKNFLAYDHTNHHYTNYHYDNVYYYHQ